MSDDLVVSAVPSSPESYIYQPQVIEDEGDVEKRNEIMSRRNDLLSRITESDKGHAALLEHEQRLSEQTRETVHKHRRVRETETKRVENLKKHRDTVRKEVVDTSSQYQKQLTEEYDEPKSKIRRKKPVKVPAPPSEV